MSLRARVGLLTDGRLRRSRSTLLAIALCVGILPGTVTAGPLDDVAAAVCDTARLIQDRAFATPAADAAGSVAGVACFRFVTTHYTTGRTQVHAGALNATSLLDVNGDGAPDVAARIAAPTIEPPQIFIDPQDPEDSHMTQGEVSADSVRMIVERLPTAAGPMDIRIEAFSPLPPNLAQEAGFGYDTGPGVEAPDAFAVTLSKPVEPINTYRLEISQYAPRTPDASLSLLGSIGFSRYVNQSVAAKLKLSPFPPSPATFDFASDGTALQINSPIRTLAEPEIAITEGPVTRRIWGVINQLPEQVSLSLNTLPGGRREIAYVASSAIAFVEINTSRVAMGSLGTPDVKATIQGLPERLSLTMPSGSEPLELRSSGMIPLIRVTAENVTLGTYNYLYATLQGIPAAPNTPHRIYPPSGSRFIQATIADGAALGLIDIELREWKQTPLELPPNTDGLFVRQELDPPAGRGHDAVHARLHGLKNLHVSYTPVGDVNIADVMVDVGAFPRFQVRVDRQTPTKAEFIQATMSSIRPRTRLTAGIGPVTKTIAYSSGDSFVRPRLDIDTNMGDRVGLHADIPALPGNLSLCVSNGPECMRNAGSRVPQRFGAHTKASISLDFNASQQTTFNFLDCIRRDAGTTSACGQDGYGKWVRANVTLQNLALDAWAEYVTEYWDGCDLCEPDNVLGHVYVDTDNLPVFTDINTDDTDGNDYNVDLNGLRAQDGLTYFDRDWDALLVGDGFHLNGTLNCGPGPELEIRPQIPFIDDPWINAAGYIC